WHFERTPDRPPARRRIARDRFGPGRTGLPTPERETGRVDAPTAPAARFDIRAPGAGNCQRSRGSRRLFWGPASRGLALVLVIRVSCSEFSIQYSIFSELAFCKL